MNKLSGVIIILLLSGLVFIYHQEILDFSTNVNTDKKADATLESGNITEAVSLYEEAAKAHPSNIELQIKLGQMYLRQGNSEAALKHYQTLVEKHPDNPDIVIAYGQLVSQQPGKLNKVLNRYRALLKTNSNNPALLNAIGTLYTQAAGNPAETRPEMKNWLADWAIYYFRLATQFDPMVFSSHFNLGVAYQNQNQLEKASKAYCNALIIGPKSFESRYNLGLVLAGQGFYDEAYRQMNEAVTLLSDTGRGNDAQMLAEKVQRIKNNVYNQTADVAPPQSSEEALVTMLPGCLMLGASPAKP